MVRRDLCKSQLTTVRYQAHPSSHRSQNTLGIKEEVGVIRDKQVVDKDRKELVVGVGTDRVIQT